MQEQTKSRPTVRQISNVSNRQPVVPAFYHREFEERHRRYRQGLLDVLVAVAVVVAVIGFAAYYVPEWNTVATAPEVADGAR